MRMALFSGTVSSELIITSSVSVWNDCYDNPTLVTNFIKKNLRREAQQHARLYGSLLRCWQRQMGHVSSHVCITSWAWNCERQVLTILGNGPYGVHLSYHIKDYWKAWVRWVQIPLPIYSSPKSPKVKSKKVTMFRPSSSQFRILIIYLTSLN